MNKQHEHFDTERLNAIPITEVARRLGCNLRRVGSVYKTICPWHEDSHPSLALYERSGEKRCHCFACGEGGSVIDLVMQSRGMTFLEACQWLSGEYGIMGTKPVELAPRASPTHKQVKQTTYTYIPKQMMEEMVTADNPLCKCLSFMFTTDEIEQVVKEYYIGCYSQDGHDNLTVFPNIDLQGRVCNLKVQGYETNLLSPRFGHCKKGTTYWLGRKWADKGLLPKGAKFNSDCMFGEHLLKRYPNKKVALVESPKNALYGALAYPQFLWVAVGNKYQIKREVLSPLKGREVLVFPDRDAIPLWTEATDGMKDLANFMVSDFCEKQAPEDQPKYDIADYLQTKLLQPL